jgi:hypothetical protein
MPSSSSQTQFFGDSLILNSINREPSSDYVDTLLAVPLSTDVLLSSPSLSSRSVDSSSTSTLSQRSGAGRTTTVSSLMSLASIRKHSLSLVNDIRSSSISSSSNLSKRPSSPTAPALSAANANPNHDGSRSARLISRPARRASPSPNKSSIPHASNHDQDMESQQISARRRLFESDTEFLQASSASLSNTTHSASAIAAALQSTYSGAFQHQTPSKSRSPYRYSPNKIMDHSAHPPLSPSLCNQPPGNAVSSPLSSIETSPLYRPARKLSLTSLAGTALSGIHHLITNINGLSSSSPSRPSSAFTSRTASPSK